MECFNVEKLKDGVCDSDEETEPKDCGCPAIL